jgi:hypothetical protein
MGEIDQHKLRSLGGVIGYLVKNKQGGYDFKVKSSRRILKDLREWEIEEAVKHPYKEK